MINTCRRLRRVVLLALIFINLSGMLLLTAGQPVVASPLLEGGETAEVPPEGQISLPVQDKGSPFGMVATLGNRVRSDEMPTAVQLMSEAGVQWQREEIFWDRVQKCRYCAFDWDGDGSGFYDYDRAIELQVNAGIRVLGLLDYNPAWFKGSNPHPDAWIEDWGNFVYASVARYGRDRGWIKYWELWNEPNLAGSGYESGLYEIKDFVRLLEVGRAAAKAADPEAQIVLGGLASIWGVPPLPHNYDYFTYLERAAELGAWNHVDIIAIHPYRPDPPEGEIGGRSTGEQDFRTEMWHLDELLRRHGPKPIWITEMGWSTNAQWPGVSLDTQAFFLLRFYIMAIAHPSIEKVFWYDFRNDTDPGAPYERPIYNDHDPQYHYGLLRRSYPLDPNWRDLRKPAFLAFRAMSNILGGLWQVQIIAEDDEVNWPGVYWYRFSDNQRRVDVLWRVRGDAEAREIECNCQRALVRGWNGEVKYLLYTGNGKLSLRLEEPGAPMFVEYDPPIKPGGEYFPTTGQTLRGSFRTYWYTHGGVERFGYPLTEEMIVPEPGHGRAHVVQYFERARFEHFPGSPNEVSLSRLGDAALLRQGINWQNLPRVSDAPEECRYFGVVGHSICPPYLAVWEQHGGLDGLGMPLTEAFPTVDQETGQTISMQHFERARLEYAPAGPGEPYRMQFGMIGREYLVRWGGMP